MLKIEFDPSNTLLAAAIGRALTDYAGTDMKGIDAEKAAFFEGKSAPTVTEQAGEKVKTTAAETVTEQDSTTDHAAEETVAGAAGPVGSGDTSAPAGAGDVDEKGVTKDDDYCATAKVPFYGTGKRKGQWKKRQGVDEDEYDEWYESQLAKISAPQPGAKETKVDTAAAFGAKAATDNAAPANGGDFMKWLSEQQNAGTVTQADIDAAYYRTGVQVADMFNPQTAGEAVAKMFAELSA